MIAAESDANSALKIFSNAFGRTMKERDSVTRIDQSIGASA
jgi:hypothetical protein